MSFEDDAREFGEFVRHGGDWRYGMLVARWVAFGSGGKRSTEKNLSVKRSAREFAEAAQVSQPTVGKYLKAWECAAENGYVPPSDAINPGEEIGLDEETHTQQLWVECYRVGNKKKPETNDPEGGNGPADVAEAKYKKVVAQKIHAASQLMELAPEDMARLPDDDEIERVERLIEVMVAWLTRIREIKGEQ